MTRPSRARCSSSSGTRLCVPRPVGHLEHGASRLSGLVGTEEAEVLRVEPHHVAQELPSTRVASPRCDPGRHVDRVVAEVGQAKVAQQHAAVGVRVGAHAPLALGRQVARSPGAGAPSRRRARRAGSCASTLRAGCRCSGFVARRSASGTWWARQEPSVFSPSTSPARSSPWGCAGRSSASAGGSCVPGSRAPCWIAGDLVDDLVE